MCSYITLPLYALVTQVLAVSIHSNSVQSMRAPPNFCVEFYYISVAATGNVSDKFIYSNGALKMGSTMKKSIFDEHTNKALKKWHMNAQKKKADGKPMKLATQTLGGSPVGSPDNSPSHSKYRAGPKFDYELTDMEADVIGQNKKSSNSPDLI